MIMNAGNESTLLIFLLLLVSAVNGHYWSFHLADTSRPAANSHFRYSKIVGGDSKGSDVVLFDDLQVNPVNVTAWPLRGLMWADDTTSITRVGVNWLNSFGTPVHPLNEGNHGLQTYTFNQGEVPFSMGIWTDANRIQCLQMTVSPSLKSQSVIGGCTGPSTTVINTPPSFPLAYLIGTEDQAASGKVQALGFAYQFPGTDTLYSQGLLGTSAGLRYSNEITLPVDLSTVQIRSITCTWDLGLESRTTNRGLIALRISYAAPVMEDASFGACPRCTFTTRTFVLDDGEYVSGVTATNDSNTDPGSYITSLQFTTNLGRTSQLMQGGRGNTPPKGQPYKQTGVLVGLAGYSKFDNSINALEFLWGPGDVLVYEDCELDADFDFSGGSQAPTTVGTVTLINFSNLTQSMTKSFTYQTTSTVEMQFTDSWKIGSSVTISAKFEGTGIDTQVTAETSQTTMNSTTSSNSTTVADTVTYTVPNNTVATGTILQQIATSVPAGFSCKKYQVINGVRMPLGTSTGTVVITLGDSVYVKWNQFVSSVGYNISAATPAV